MRSLLQRGRAAIAVLALGVFAACWVVQTPPLALTPPIVDEPALAELPEVLTLPETEPPPTPAEALELRLAALAHEIERRRAMAPPPGLIELDVEGLAASLNALLQRYEDKASVSVHVRDLETGHVLFDYFGDSPLIPASNQKLVTSAAALDLLGPDYVFDTRVARDGPDLYLAGQGDPMLLVDDLAAIASLTAGHLDVAELERLYVDDTAFSSRAFGPGYDPEGPGYAYQAPSGALSLSFNTVEVTVYPVAGSSRLGVSVSPPSAHVRVENRARRGGSKNRVIVRSRAEGDHTVVSVEGSLPRGHGPVVVRRRITDPGLHTAEAFAALLAELTGTEPLPVERRPVPAEAETVVVNESLPLLEILDDGLAYSNNFIAEQVLRTLAWRMTGDPGDWDAGEQILHDYWATLTGPQPLVVENASGLSRRARLTTHGLVDLIAVAHRSALPEGSLIDALPVAGERGTMRSRLRLSGKRVRAKTGTLDGVSGLTGVITSEGGEPLVGFSILTNTAPDAVFVADSRRALEDRIVMDVLRALDDYEAQRAGLQAPRGAAG
ncbi:MAG: D-alanyl-D-alanine carboxypeptidase/D-alanyl-D-alanine-endopeptidase [Myxococcales bacterium]|nr:D-alanyl-D-alanine carboxypeptidase/D-alanyl-D-alanine-endopeptidase [Myxococcales bacterium]MCB9716178.1 D-alanyl-D-alanine carboxypeptidase/D-alanyl-D-alanine-endopeptidase [Myxococcales bacterium]